MHTYMKATNSSAPSPVAPSPWSRTTKTQEQGVGSAPGPVQMPAKDQADSKVRGSALGKESRRILRLGFPAAGMSLD